MEMEVSNKKTNNSVSVAVRMPKKLHEELKKLAAEDHRTLGNFMRMHLEKLTEIAN